MTLDIVVSMIKSIVIKADGSSALADNHFAEIEGIREESTLLLRNFYKVSLEWLIKLETSVFDLSSFSGCCVSTFLSLDPCRP